MPDLKTTYGPNSVRSTGPSMPDDGGGGGVNDELFDKVMRKRLLGLLGGGKRRTDFPSLGRPRGGGGRGAAAPAQRPQWGGGRPSGGSAVHNAKKRDEYETNMLRAQSKLATASARPVPKVRKNIGMSSYLTDDWDDVPLALRPSGVNLQTGGDVANRDALTGAKNAAFKDKMAADRERGRTQGF